MIFLILSVILLSKSNSYLLKFKTFLLLVFTCVRVLMVFTFTIDQYEGEVLYFY